MKWIDNITYKIKSRLDIPSEDTTKDELIQDYINEVFVEIVDYTNTSKYIPQKYDYVLIQCVVALIRRVGVEGTKSRSMGGIMETYDNSVVTAPIISSKLVQIIRPVGYNYPSDRYNFPDGE